MKRLLSVVLLVSLLCFPSAFADQLTEPLNEGVPFGVVHSTDLNSLTVYSAVNARTSIDKLADYQLCAILSTKKSGSTLWYQVRYISNKSLKEGYIKGDVFYPFTLAGLITITADSTAAETLRTLISESRADPFVSATASPTPKPTSTPKLKTTAAPTSTPKAKKTAAPSSVRKKYVLNTKTMKFHLPSCSEVDRIAEENRKNTTTTRESLIDQGYTPCQKCNP